MPCREPAENPVAADQFAGNFGIGLTRLFVVGGYSADQYVRVILADHVSRLLAIAVVTSVQKIVEHALDVPGFVPEKWRTGWEFFAHR